jgi:hypothetical protein
MTREYHRIDLTADDPIVTQTQANTEYRRNGMIFRTDDYGRTIEVIVEDLDYGEAARRQSPRQLTGSEPTSIDPDGETIIEDSPTTTDLRKNPRYYYADGTEILWTQNGHIVANRLGGPPDAFNLVPQSMESNLSTYKRDVEHPVNETINANPDTQLVGRYRITYSNDVDARDFYVPRDMHVDTYVAADIADGTFAEAEQLASHHHRHYYDPDLHDPDHYGDEQYYRDMANEPPVEPTRKRLIDPVDEDDDYSGVW